MRTLHRREDEEDEEPLENQMAIYMHDLSIVKQELREESPDVESEARLMRLEESLEHKISHLKERMKESA